MSEEVKPVESQEHQDTPAQKTQTPEPTSIELKAMEMGWRPKTEFDGEEDDFIDAKEFVRRKPLFEKIENTTKEVKQLRKAMEALKQHYTAKEQAAVTAALKRLEEARTEAISNADGDTFAKVDREIKRVEAEANELQRINQEVQTTPEIHPTFVEWVRKNPWYEKDEPMRVYADELGRRLGRQPNADPVAILGEVEKAIKKEFPHKFKNPNKENAPDVDSSGRSPAGRKSSDTVELTDSERKVMNMLVSTKQMTKEEYLADIKKMRAAASK